MQFLAKNKKADITALCDIYQPSLDRALKIAPNAKTYKDYRHLLEDKNIDAIVIATPLAALSDRVGCFRCGETCFLRKKYRLHSHGRMSCYVQ